MNDLIYHPEQLTPSRSSTGRLIGVIALAFVALFLPSRMASAQTLFNVDFDSDQGYTAGALVGQNNWALPTSGYSYGPTILAGTGTDTTNVIEGNSLGASGAANSNYFTAGTLSTSSIVTLTLDVESTNASSIAVAGIGGSPATENAHAGDHESSTFGEWSGQLAFYQAYPNSGVSNPVYASTSSSSQIPFTLTSGDQYAVQSVWNLANNTATLSYEDLTLGQTSFTTLYFSGSTTIAIEGTTGTYNGLTLDPVSGWNTAYIRMSPSGNPSFMDNFSAVATTAAVPEPSTYVLLLANVGIVLLFWRRRSSRFLA